MLMKLTPVCLFFYPKSKKMNFQGPLRKYDYILVLLEITVSQILILPNLTLPIILNIPSINLAGFLKSLAQFKHKLLDT